MARRQPSTSSSRSCRVSSTLTRTEPARLLLVPEEDRESDPLELLHGAEGIDEGVLGSHLLESGDVVDLDAGGTTAILARRSERLAAVRESFLDRTCEWDQADTADMEMLGAAAEAFDAAA